MSQHVMALDMLISKPILCVFSYRLHWLSPIALALTGAILWTKPSTCTGASALYTTLLSYIKPVSCQGRTQPFKK